jgi:hypothetical protein
MAIANHNKIKSARCLDEFDEKLKNFKGTSAREGIAKKKELYHQLLRGSSPRNLIHVWDFKIDNFDVFPRGRLFCL